MDLITLKAMFKGRDAYLVGGAARNVYENKVYQEFRSRQGPPKDWDVLVVGELPDLPHPFVKNSFGGRKYRDLGMDLWSDDVGKYLREVPRGRDGIAIHLETGAVLLTEEYVRHHCEDVSGRPVRRRPAKLE